MAMLQGKVAFHDIQDVEAFTGRIVHEWLTGPRHLRPHHRESLHAYLIATTYELSKRYERKPRRWSFSKYAHSICRRRIADWYREELGDSRRDSPDKQAIRFPDHLSQAMGIPDPTTRDGIPDPVPGSVLGSDRDPDDLLGLNARRHQHRARNKRALREGVSRPTTNRAA